VQRTRFLIIGAGVTGLSFASQLTERDYLICEAADEIGGYCRTIQRDGFVWDYSGHFFHFRHPEIERELVQAIGPARVRRIVKVFGMVNVAPGFTDTPTVIDGCSDVLVDHHLDQGVEAYLGLPAEHALRL